MLQIRVIFHRIRILGNVKYSCAKVVSQNMTRTHCQKYVCVKMLKTCKNNFKIIFLSDLQIKHAF